LAPTARTNGILPWAGGCQPRRSSGLRDADEDNLAAGFVERWACARAVRWEGRRRGDGPGQTRPAQEFSRALADVATIALIQEQALREARDLAEQLQTALMSRVVIEQAKGVLAGKAGVGMDSTFTLMRNYARSRNVFLVAVAREVVGGRLSVADITRVGR
jgi:ANTAR domain